MWVVVAVVSWSIFLTGTRHLRVDGLFLIGGYVGYMAVLLGR
jgi:hypothetical protein